MQLLKKLGITTEKCNTEINSVIRKKNTGVINFEK